MQDWFSELPFFDKFYWVVAIAGSVAFVILLVMTLVGGDVDDVDGDVDGDFDGGIDFQFLSLKNLVGFFTIFGWVGISCIAYDTAKPITILVSVIAGLMMMFAMASLFYYLSRMTHDGSLKLKNAIGATGEVYLMVGAERSRVGKIQINVQGHLRELEAITDSSADLMQGDVVRVSDITSNGMLVVSKHLEITI